MGLFGGLKKLFKKSVGLKEKDRTELVHFYRLKKGLLKVGTEINVDENYVAVLTHKDKLCDVLLPGKHIFDDVGMPKLNKCNKPIKTRRGYVTPKSIQADVYFVNTNSIHNIPFKSQKIKAYNNGQKTKVRLIGTYTVKVEDAKKLVGNLLLDMAVIKRGVALNEVNASIKYAITDILQINVYTLDEYLKRDPKIIELLDSYITKKISDYGVSVTNVQLGQIVSYAKKSKKSDDKVPEDMVNVDNLCKKLEKQDESEQFVDNIPVLVTVGADEKETTAKTNTKIIDNSQSNFESSYNEYLNEVRTQNEDINEPEPNIIDFNEKDNDIQANELVDNADVFSNNDKIHDIDNNIDDKVKQLETEQEKLKAEIDSQHQKCRKCGVLLPNDAKFCYNCGSSTSEFKICPCCGAKNFQNATTCITCKSKLD